MTITTIGLDTSKTWFQVHCVDADGGTVLQRKVARSTVRHYLAVVQRRPGALRNGACLPGSAATDAQDARGDREMVEILALALQHEEQAVLAAVELALEAGRVDQNPCSEPAAPLG
jgi:hypothetical protein